MNLTITENPAEMERIGREIVAEKKDIYTDKVFGGIAGTVRQALPQEMKEKAESIAYITIYDYWTYGVATDEWFYYGFSGRTHEDKNSYMTNRWRSIYIDHLNKREDKYILENKYEAYKRFREYYRRDVIEIRGDSDFGVFEAFVGKHPSFVVKPGGLALGIGVYKVEEGDYTDIRELFQRILADNRKCAGQYKWSYSEGVVLEELIRQDERMAAFHPYSINSVRITTVRIGDKVHLVHPWLKVGVNGMFVVCASLGSFDAGIDPETGIVNTEGWLETRKTYHTHPNSGITIPGFQVPEWPAAVELVTKLALSLDTLHYAGWDMVLSKDGWCVMEGNVYGDFMWQLCYDRGMKAEFEELIGWKSEKQFWWE